MISEEPMSKKQCLRMGAWLEGERGLYSVAHIAERPADNLAGKVRFRKDRREDLRRLLAAEDITTFPRHWWLMIFSQDFRVFCRAIP